MPKKLIMSIIEKLARQSFDRNIENGFDNYKDVINKIRYGANDINSKLDKIKFLNIHLDLTNDEYNKHLLVCTNPEQCQENIDYESIAYFLRQELENLDVTINEDTFTVEEKNKEDEKLDRILRDMQELKLGHQIIYDDLLSEINELRELYFLGKKKWHQMLAGKFVDMAVSGVVSETISKQIIESIKPDFTKFIS
jgi:hypothetical protein